MHVCLVHKGTSRVQDLPLDIAFPVRRVVHAQPYVLLLTDNSQMILLTITDVDGQGELLID